MYANGAPIFIGIAPVAVRVLTDAKETAMQIAAGTLSRALKRLVRLVPKRTAFPIAEHVLFEPTDSGIAITATDLTTQAQIVIPATATFAACLPARPLLESRRAESRSRRLPQMRRFQGAATRSRRPPRGRFPYRE